MAAQILRKGQKPIATGQRKEFFIFFKNLFYPRHQLDLIQHNLKLYPKNHLSGEEEKVLNLSKSPKEAYGIQNLESLVFHRRM